MPLQKRISEERLVHTASSASTFSSSSGSVEFGRGGDGRCVGCCPAESNMMPFVCGLKEGYKNDCFERTQSGAHSSRNKGRRWSMSDVVY